MPPATVSRDHGVRNVPGGIVSFLLMVFGFFTFLTLLVAVAVLTFGVGSEAETFRYVGF